MNSNLDEWQGFESFAEDNVMYSYQPEKYNTFQHEPKPQINIKIAPHLTKSSFMHNKRIINFKSKNNRKFSHLHTEQPKKQNYKKEVENIKEQKPLSTCLERPIKKIIVTHAKEQIIPIYRIPNLSQHGKLVYKGLLPKTVQEYFNIIQKDQLRSSWQTVITYESQEDELTFDSKFQSGNLQSVRKINNDYHLYITPDTNTKGHRQWFYFTVSSCKKIKVTLIIHQFKKKLSLFQSGMRPYGKKLQEGVQGWKPIGFNIKYEKEQLKIMDSRQKNIGQTTQDLFLLSFDLQIQANNTYCIASCIPYTYNYLKSQLSQLYSASYQNITIQESVLCKTLSGLDVPLITINSQLQKEVQPKKYIIINARSHPGQTSSSWVTQGLIEQLYTSKKAQNIIKQTKVVIKIVPMLNPDGVYMGNYRTGVMGIDFNRLFLTGKPDFFPEIQGLKQLVKNCKAQGDVDLYLDLHGHSILPGCFIYGPDPMFCPFSQLKNFNSQLKSSKYFASKHSISGQINTKTETSRVYFQLQEGVYSLTIQNSLGLYYKNKDKSTKQQFQSKDWKQFGKELIIAILKPYQKKKTLDHDELPFERFLSLRRGQKKDSVAEMKRFKTDTTGDLNKQISLLNQIESDHIVLQNQYKISKSIPEEIQSLNDSDSQSQDLSPQKRQELFTIVKKVVEKRQVNDHSSSQNAKKQQQYRSKDKNTPDKSQPFMNFKQYRFGYQQITLADWHARKRLLSIPKALKSQKLNQSYIIRKTVAKPFASQLFYQTNQSNKKVKTQSRQQNYKKIKSRLQSSISGQRTKEKHVIQQYFSRRH